MKNWAKFLLLSAILFQTATISAVCPIKDSEPKLSCSCCEGGGGGDDKDR